MSSYKRFNEENMNNNNNNSSRLTMKGGRDANVEPQANVDHETRKIIKEQKQEIRQDQIKIWISIGIASLALVATVIAWPILYT